MGQNITASGTWSCGPTASPGCCEERRKHKTPISRRRRPEGRGENPRPQALLDGDLLFDFPPDACRHALRRCLEPARVHTLLVPHSHIDRRFPTGLIHRHEHFVHGTDGMLEVYGNQAAKDAFGAHILVDRFKVHPIEGVVNFHVNHGGDSFSVNGWEITAVSAGHDVREECLIYICKRDGKVVFYGHDTGAGLSRAAWEPIERERFDLVSPDAAMGKKSSPGYHMGLPNVEDTLRRLEDLGYVDGRTVNVINHFSRNGGMAHDRLSAWRAEWGILAAYDGMEATF